MEFRVQQREQNALVLRQIVGDAMRRVAAREQQRGGNTRSHSVGGDGDVWYTSVPAQIVTKTLLEAQSCRVHDIGKRAVRAVRKIVEMNVTNAFVEDVGLLRVQICKDEATAADAVGIGVCPEFE